MVNINQTSSRSHEQIDSEYDVGLRTYMRNVYTYMSSALIVTGLVAYLVSSMLVIRALDGSILGLTSFGSLILGNSIVRILLVVAPLGLVFAMDGIIMNKSKAFVFSTFYIFAALMGLSLSTIFLAYTLSSITQVFFITSIAFAGLSLWGYTTRRNLSALGSFCIMGVVGLIAASLVNLFLGSSLLDFGISIFGVFIFSGLVAWNNQSIKHNYYASGGGELAERLSVHGALRLYLDFINLFVMLLRLLGNRSD